MMYINADKNDNFSFLRGFDLQDLLSEVYCYFLQYRKTLHLPSYITFGVEIEYEQVSRLFVDRYITKKLKEWHSTSDGSLNSGGEIVSPIMKDTPKYWSELQLVCDYLTKKGANTQNNAGGHIHVGAFILKEDMEAWRQFLKLYIVYENVLFRFLYGDKINRRKKMDRYAPPVADMLYGSLKLINSAQNLKDIYRIVPTYKYSALNFSHMLLDPCANERGNTIEFRSPNGSTNPIIWQNNINALTKCFYRLVKK